MSDLPVTTTPPEALQSATTAVQQGASPTNPAAVYLASLRPSGRYTMMRTLDRLAATMGHTWKPFPWAQLRYEHVQAIRAQLSEQYKASTVNLSHTLGGGED